MGREETKVRVNPKYKDTIFRMIFREKKELLSLYNAVSGSNYEDAEQLEIVTLENVVYMNMKNDLAFIIDFQLSLFEHQSTYNPNIPLRDLFYVAREYEMLVDKRSLYGTKLVKIPTPEFIVFYNGMTQQPERKICCLSEAFIKKVDDLSLELKVQMININKGMNTEIMKACKTLKDYSIYVDKVRTYAEEQPLQEAVERTVDECIRNDILADFLRKNRAEAISMSIFEYDEEEVMRQLRKDYMEEGYEEGYEKGKEAGKKDALLDMIRKKLEKGKSREQIADELEESLETIEELCQKL